MFKIGVYFLILGINVVFGNTFNVSSVSEFRTALEDASLNGSNDTIILDAGTYYLNEDGEGSFTFADTEEYNLTITSSAGLTQDDVVLDGSLTDTILNVSIAGNGILFINKITLKNGKKYLGNHIYKEGGGIYSNTSVELTHSKIVHCAGQNGGAISIHWSKYGNSSGYLKVIDSNLTDNTSSYYGAAIYAGNNLGKIELSKTEIVGNTAWYDDGNILELGGNDHISIDNCLIKKNLSKQRGSIILLRTGASSSSSITFTEIINNSVGSAPILKAYKNFIMHDSILDANVGSWMMSIEEGKFYNNKFINQTAGSSHYYIKKGILVNNIFQNNVITETSTALIVMEDGGYVVNNTFYQNKDTSGYAYNAVLNFKGIVINTIFHDDIVTNAIKFTGDSSVYNTYVDYSKLLNNDNYRVIKKNNKKPTNGDISLDLNGKPLENSLAIHNGLDPYSDTFKNLINDATVYDTILEILQTDLEGKERISGEGIDIGAYEYASDNVTPPLSPLIMYLLN